MEGFMPTLSASAWQDLCRELGLSSSGSSDSHQARVLAHIQSEEGKRALHDGGSPALRGLMRSLGLPLPANRPAGLVGHEPGFYCICGLTGAGNTVTCTRCGSVQHRACMGKAALLANYECANCQMRQMEPFEQVMEVVLGATVCATQGGAVDSRTFLYKAETHARLAPGSDKRRSIQIRCIRLSAPGFVQNWPKDCTIYINSRAIYTLSQPPASSTRKRKDSPLSLSNFPPNSHNSVMVVKQKEDDSYAFGIFVVETLTVEEVFNRYLYERVLTQELGKAFVKGRASSSEEIQAAAYRQPLVCPLTRMVPDIPARGTLCQHVQCFDLLAYVVLQEKTKTNKWHCPICFGLVLRITVDEYMKEIVERARKIEGCEAVEFAPDGGYKLIVEDRNAVSDEELDTSSHVRPVNLEDDDHPSKHAHIPPIRLNWPDFQCLTPGPSFHVVHLAQSYKNAADKLANPRKKDGQVVKVPASRPSHPIIDLD